MGREDGGGEGWEGGDVNGEGKEEGIVEKAAWEGVEWGEAGAEGGGGAATGRLSLTGPVMDLLTPFTEEGDVDFVAFGRYLQVCAHCAVISQ